MNVNRKVDWIEVLKNILNELFDFAYEFSNINNKTLKK